MCRLLLTQAETDGMQSINNFSFPAFLLFSVSQSRSDLQYAVSGSPFVVQVYDWYTDPSKIVWITLEVRELGYAAPTTKDLTSSCLSFVAMRRRRTHQTCRGLCRTQTAYSGGHHLDVHVPTRFRSPALPRTQGSRRMGLQPQDRSRRSQAS